MLVLINAFILMGILQLMHFTEHCFVLFIIVAFILFNNLYGGKPVVRIQIRAHTSYQRFKEILGKFNSL